MHVRDDSKIYTGRAVHGGKKNIKGSLSKDKGELDEDLLIRYLWMKGAYIIHDMRAVNTEATSYQSKKPEKCLETAEKAKKKKDLDTCLKHCCNFTTFVASVESLIRVKAEATLKHIASRLMTKWKEPYSWICGYMK